MLLVYLGLVQILRTIWRVLREPEMRAIVSLTVVTLALGTIFYHNIEQWGWVDSFYFSVITLTTVGYGDLAPTSAWSKLFTVLYIILGLGILTGFITSLGTQLLREREERGGALRHRLHGETTDETKETNPS